MLKIYFILLLTFCCKLITAQTAQQNDIAAIKAARTASNKSIAAHDVDGIAKYWLSDFVQVRGNSTHLTGKDTIIASWRDLFTENPKVVFVRNPTDVEISDNDTLAWETGNWIGRNSYSKGGNYSAMWKKVDNTWKLQAEIFVSLKQQTVGNKSNKK